MTGRGTGLTYYFSDISSGGEQELSISLTGVRLAVRLEVALAECGGSKQSATVTDLRFPLW